MPDIEKCDQETTSSSHTASSTSLMTVPRSVYFARERLFVIILGVLLSFNTGFSNGITLSGFLTPNSSHWISQATGGFTSAYTKSAMAVVDTNQQINGMPNIEFFGFQICMILSFAGGSFIASLLIPRPVAWRLQPMYAPVFLIGALLMTGAAVLACAEADPAHGKVHYFFLVVAANGVQNGLSSMYSANLLRTAGATGATTDVGLYLGQYLRGNRKNTWKLQVLAALLTSLWFGGLMSFYAARAWLNQALIFNASVFALLFLIITGFLAWHMNVAPHKAVLGAVYWHWAMRQLQLRDSEGDSVDAEAAAAVFYSMDKDMDGYIDIQELDHGLRQAGLTFSAGRLAIMFAVCDRDNCGRLSEDDWIVLVQGENRIVA